jgi:hypothetical protein
VTVSTVTVVPEASASGTAPCAEPYRPWSQTFDLAAQAVARATRPDFDDWLTHIRPAAACTRPVRLSGAILTLEAGTGRLLSSVNTASMPDGVIYKACGNRRASVCPACSDRYKRDAYHVVRAGLVGGKGVPEHVASHPAVFPTFTAPSFGEVHTRVVKRHTCQRRSTCDCRPEPCHARRERPVCPHGTPLVCFARHDDTDKQLGRPMCLDCYDHAAQVVWNLHAGELWRRTTIAITRHLRRIAWRRGISADSLRLSFGKAAEMQRRAVIHFHAIIRLDGASWADPTLTLPPPPGLDAADLVDAIDYAAASVTFHTDPHPTRPEGWEIRWGDQVHTKVITVAGNGEVTDGMVAAYLAKYSTKSTEVTGHMSGRITQDTVDLFANPTGSHTERLIDACWQLGRARWTCDRCKHESTRRECPTCAVRRGAEEPKPSPYPRLHRWAHMLGFGGHFLTKSRRYSITFNLLRQSRITWRRTTSSGPEQDDRAPQEETTLVVNYLQFVGAGWHTTADGMLANASAARAREHGDEPTHHRTTVAP